MTYTFNLIDQPWIPCLQKGGGIVELGLGETFARAHEMREVQGDTPLETAAIYRLLLATLHRIFGPANPRDWKRLWSAGRWDATQVEEYLECWHARFDLFDEERPFYQATDLDFPTPKSIINAIPQMASGNNATLFDHHLEGQGATLDPAQAARTLLTVQAFGLGGLSGQKERPYTDAPWGRGVIFLMEGDTLFETLALNLFPPNPDQQQPDDCPAWECNDPFSPSREHPHGYLDLMTWQSRRVLLLPEEVKGRTMVRNIRIAPGLRLSASVLDPYKHYRKSKTAGLISLRFLEDRALWRDQASLLRYMEDFKEAFPPENLRWIAKLYGAGAIDLHNAYRCMGLGMANDQAKVDFMRHERLPIPGEYFANIELVDRLNDALQFAEQTRGKLWAALHDMAAFFLYPQVVLKNQEDKEKRFRLNEQQNKEVNRLMDHWGAERIYWSTLEMPFFRLLAALPKDADLALKTWQAILRGAAWEAFRFAENLVGDSNEGLRATVAGSGQLAYGLATLFPNLKPEQERIL